MTTPTARFLKRWLFIGHRWVGIATCLLCAMWFVSGVVMMYVPYPRLTDGERLASLTDIRWSQIAVAPDDAMRAAGLTRYPLQLRLTMLAGEPVYRTVDGTTRRTISARDGRVIGAVDAAGAVAIVCQGRSPTTNAAACWCSPPLKSEGKGGVEGPADPASKTLFHPSPFSVKCDATVAVAPSSYPSPVVEILDRDQWTVAGGFDPHRPLHKVSLGDDAGTDLYVSSRTGEIVQRTTRSERFWNWVGSVPHWLYPTVLRQDGDAWRQVVLWTAGPATLGAIAGLWVGILRLRVRRRYRGHRLTPYRGWMEWHHVSGIIAGLFLTTWLASGWLSVNPFRWFDRAPPTPVALRAYAGEEKPVFPVDVSALQGLRSDGAREARFVWLNGRALIVTTDATLAHRVFDGHRGEHVALSDTDIRAAAQKLMPGVPLQDLVRLTEEDAYWYSHHVERRLPVMRAIFADDAATWVHIDPDSGEILGRTDRSGRAYRWLFNAFHDFDMGVLLRHRPAWDIVVWLLSLGGLIVSVSGVVIGWRRLGRKLA